MSHLFSLKGTAGLFTWHMSTAQIPDIPVGSQINEGRVIQSSNGFKLPYRIVGLKNKKIAH